MDVLAFPEAEVPEALRDQVLELEREAWGQLARPGPRHDPALRPLSLLLVDEGRVLSALDILSTELVHGGRAFAASGLSTVVTATELRGRGYGSRLVRAAREAIAESGADLGIFTCDPPLRRFYERAGWRSLPGTVLVGGTPEAPFPSDRLGKVAMAGFFTPHARRHAATFVGARIELYPGEIDRLW